MEGNSAGPEPSPKGRTAGFWILGTLAVLLAVWGVSQYIEYLGKGTPIPKDASGGGQDLLDAPTHPVSAQIDVKVVDEKNTFFPVGTALPRQLMLSMANPEGQEYSMPFDKVGTWAVDAPPGDYLVPLEQKHLGNWRWKLEGEGVTLDSPAKAYRLKLAGRKKPLAMKLALY